MTTYTDEQLKRALAKMLPEALRTSMTGDLRWRPTDTHSADFVRDSELLHLCSLVEETLSQSEEEEYYLAIEWNYRASWQQRTIAAAMVKGVEIV